MLRTLHSKKKNEMMVWHPPFLTLPSACGLVSSFQNLEGHLVTFSLLSIQIYDVVLKYEEH